MDQAQSSLPRLVLYLGARLTRAPSWSVHFLPATLRLALADPQPRLLPPFHLFHPRQNFRIWVSFSRSLLDLHRSHFLTHFLEDLTKKVLLLRRTGSVRTCRANIVFVPADLGTGRPARRLDVYLTDENDTTGEDKENVPLAQVIILLAFPSYRLAGSRAFPASAIAAQLRSTLDVCVVVPSLTPFTNDEPEGEALERMVGETRECVKWVGENIARYGGDSEQIWFMGFGAGAHIASVSSRTRSVAPETPLNRTEQWLLTLVVTRVPSSRWSNPPSSQLAKAISPSGSLTKRLA